MWEFSRQNIKDASEDGCVQSPMTHILVLIHLCLNMDSFNYYSSVLSHGPFWEGCLCDVFMPGCRGPEW